MSCLLEKLFPDDRPEEDSQENVEITRSAAHLPLLNEGLNNEAEQLEEKNEEVEKWFEL